MHDMRHQHGVPKPYNRAFAIGIALNVVFVIIEVVYGVLADSLALVADAGHNLSDVVSLVLAWVAAYLATRRPTPRRTYGYRKVTILASLASAFLLLVALGVIIREAIGRFQRPDPVDGMTVIVVAAAGVVINTITALLFVSGQKHDLNIKGAFLHMAADAAVSLGVVLSGVAILFTGWLWLDPAISIIIALVILVGTWGLLRDSLGLVIDFVPRGIDVDAVTAYLCGLPGVTELHDLHIWAMSTTEVALTAHVVMPDGMMNDDFLDTVSDVLYERFHIQHMTLQVEGGGECKQAHPDTV